MTQDEIEANRKGDITLRLLGGDAIFVGVQTLNELYNVFVRKKFDRKKTRLMLDTLATLCQGIVPLTLNIHQHGRFLHKKYRLQFYDALMLAAGLEAHCATFYSEDMQHGQVIERAMTIINPFRLGQ